MIKCGWRPLNQSVQAYWIRAVFAMMAFALVASDGVPARCRAAEELPSTPAPVRKVYVVPIRADIAPPLVYVVRRGVKEAMEAKASVLVLDMETNGGRVDITEEIIEIIGRFQGPTVTYVNRKAFSAGAFIAVATQKIYMAPQSVIGAAAPMMMIPGGGPAEIPDTVEAKMTSAVRAMIRANAEKNGYNVEVIEAMIDKTRRLEVDGEVLNEKGQILTLTNVQAEKKYGADEQPLLSSGTASNLDNLLTLIGMQGAEIHRIEPTGVEKLGTWINAISPLLLMIGIIGLYIEFKTPGFGLPGIVGLSAFAVYFIGGFIAGLSGMEWIALFLLGLVLVIVEFFVIPGTTIAGLLGALCMVAAILMAMVDIYPALPPAPGPMPTGVTPPVRFVIGWDRMVATLAVTVAGALAGMWALAQVFPRLPAFQTLTSQAASGEADVRAMSVTQESMLGRVGVTLSVLRPGGKAQFGQQILDVLSQGDLVPKGSRVKIIRYSGREAVVAVADESSPDVA